MGCRGALTKWQASIFATNDGVPNRRRLHGTVRSAGADPSTPVGDGIRATLTGSSAGQGLAPVGLPFPEAATTRPFDRFHAYAGLGIPKMRPGVFTNQYGPIVDYLAEYCVNAQYKLPMPSTN